MSKATFGKNFQKGPGRNGETTYIMYHGTTMKAAQKIKRYGFICSADGMLGPGVYVSRSFKKAACYPKRAKGHKLAVLKLSVRVGRVKKIDRQDHHLQKSWHQAGYDTAWVPPNCGMVKSGRQENCVWDPKRIRVLSIQNNKGESSDEESTDDSSTNEDDSFEEDDDDDDDVTDTKSIRSEESTDSSDERSSRHSSDTSTEEYVNSDDSSSDHDDDTSSDHSDDAKASDEEEYKCDESSAVLTETDACECSVQFSDDSSESDDDY